MYNSYKKKNIYIYKKLVANIMFERFGIIFSDTCICFEIDIRKGPMISFKSKLTKTFCNKQSLINDDKLCNCNRTN